MIRFLDGCTVPESLVIKYERPEDKDRSTDTAATSRSLICLPVHPSSQIYISLLRLLSVRRLNFVFSQLNSELLHTSHSTGGF